MKNNWKLVIASIVSIIVIFGVIVLWEGDKHAQRVADSTRRLLEATTELENMEGQKEAPSLNH